MATMEEVLAHLRASRLQVQKSLAGVTEGQMTLPIPGRQTPANVRFMFYRLIAHEAEHTVHLIKTLDALGIRQREAQLILRDLQEARGKLEGLLVGLSDEELERRLGDDWSPRQVIEHIVETEEAYTSRIRDALQGAGQG